jgi:TRAP-type C4-dicarboxylate transport system permease small subunit
MALRVLTILDRTLVAVAVAAFIGMMLATGAQVIFRYVLEISVGWTEELARVLFTTAIFLGIAIATRERQHIVVDFLLKRLGPRSRRVVGFLFDFIIIAILMSMLRGAITMVDLTWESYMIAMPWMRTGYLFLVECLAIGLVMFYVAIDLVGRLPGGAAGQTPGGDP